MINSDPTYFASIFDDDHTTDFTIWKKNANVTKKLSENRLHEGILFKRSKGTNFWKSRYYVLFDDRLAYYKNGREKKEQAFCYINNMRAERIQPTNDKDDKFGIRFMQNGQYFDLFARAKDVQDKWMSKLKEFCVMTNYNNYYSNIKVIGKGSFAKVYLAKRKSDNAEFAVKTFDKSAILKQEKAKPSLLNEISIMRRLEHENIIKLYEVFESPQHICLVLELLHGGELFNKITKKGHYSEKEACALMKKLLSAMDYLHHKGIMHRDIKLENLILKDVDNDVEVKIVDFGLATFLNTTEWLFRRCGTPGYVAPEILADEKYDQKVDVFSCGVILYILLTGGSPFYGKSYNEILNKNKKCEIRYDFAERGKKISEQAIDLVRKMLQKDPKNRISCKEALAHEWIANDGSVEPEEKQLQYLLSAQENMKKFQEENRFNVKNIKPKDLDKATLEKAWHCPSPIINGNVLTVADSRIMSPKTPIIGHQEGMATPSRTPIGMKSPTFMPQARNGQMVMGWIAPGGQWTGPQQQRGQDGENVDMYGDESAQRRGFKHPMFGKFGANAGMPPNTNNSQSSSNSGTSTSNTPFAKPTKKPADDKEFKKRALIVQESLLSYIKNADPSKAKTETTQAQNPESAAIKYQEEDGTERKNPKEEEKVSSVKSLLRNLH